MPAMLDVQGVPCRDSPQCDQGVDALSERDKGEWELGGEGATYTAGRTRRTPPALHRLHVSRKCPGSAHTERRSRNSVRAFVWTIIVVQLWSGVGDIALRTEC